MMITAILDTNVIVQSAISSPRSASAQVLDAYYDGRFELIYSFRTLDELLDVFLLPDIRQLHGFSDDEILEFIASVLSCAHRASGMKSLSHSLTRDITDTKFLALAEETGADYLVTNDRRHLLRLGDLDRRGSSRQHSSSGSFLSTQVERVRTPSLIPTYSGRSGPCEIRRRDRSR